MQLAGDGAALAASFASAGLVPGDRIAIWCGNGLPYLRVLAAAAAGGFVVVSVNTRFSTDEARSIIARSGATLLVTDHEIAADLGAIGVVDAAEIAQRVANADDVVEPPAVQARADDRFVVFTTSGTTSRPKLVVHAQRSMAVHGADIAVHFGYDRSSRIMIALPLCGVFGLSGLMGALAGGSDVWLPDRFDAEAVATTVERVAITALNAPDDAYHRLLATDHDLSSITVGGFGQFNSSLHDIVERADKRGVTLTGLYGMSEVQALFLLQDPSQPVELRQRGGGHLVSPRAAARVVDPDTNEPLPEGTDGELQLQGPSLFDGYLAEGGDSIDHDLTGGAQVVDADDATWFRSGDLARAEPDGSFTFLTRMGDVLRLGGFLVSPAEIEDVIVEIDGVAEAQVVPVARPEGVRPVAIVIADLAADNVPVDEAAIKAHCAARLAKFKVPIKVIGVEAFPVTQSANGTKIQRNKLAEMAQQALTE